MRGYGFGATTPAPVPYSKQTDAFLTDIVKRYGVELDSIVKKLSGKITAAEKTTLQARQALINKDYYIPARQELINRGYSVVGASVMKVVTPSKDTTPSTVKPVARTYIPTDTSKPFSPVATSESTSGMNKNVMLALAAAGVAVWWFFIRKKPSSGLSVLKA